MVCQFTILQISVRYFLFRRATLFVRTCVGIAICISICIAIRLTVQMAVCLSAHRLTSFTINLIFC